MLSGNPYNGTTVSGVTVNSGNTTVNASFGNNFGGIPVGTEVSVSGSGIASGTTVADVGSGNNPTSLVLSTAPTSTHSNVTLTFSDPGLANDPAAVWPTLCDTTGSAGIYIDAAVFALNGSFGDQNWNLSPFSNYVNLNGTDLSEYRGPFGTFNGGGGTTGYEKRISFDQRLDFLSPRSSSPAACRCGCSRTTSNVRKPLVPRSDERGRVSTHSPKRAQRALIRATPYVPVEELEGRPHIVVDGAARPSSVLTLSPLAAKPDAERTSVGPLGRDRLCLPSCIAGRPAVNRHRLYRYRSSSLGD